MTFCVFLLRINILLDPYGLFYDSGEGNIPHTNKVCIFAAELQIGNIYVMVKKRPQVIIWTNDALIYQRKHMSLTLKEFIWFANVHVIL